MSLQDEINELNLTKELNYLQSIENWFSDKYKVSNLEAYRFNQQITIALPDIDSMTDAIDEALTFEPIPIYKIERTPDPDFVWSNEPPSEDDVTLIHPVICSVSYGDPEVRFFIDSPFGILRVCRRVTGSKIQINSNAYGNPLKYRNVELNGYEPWFNSCTRFHANEYCIDSFIAYNKEN